MIPKKPDERHILRIKPLNAFRGALVGDGGDVPEQFEGFVVDLEELTKQAALVNTAKNAIEEEQKKTGVLPSLSDSAESSFALRYRDHADAAFSLAMGDTLSYVRDGTDNPVPKEKRAELAKLLLDFGNEMSNEFGAELPEAFYATLYPILPNTVRGGISR